MSDFPINKDAYVAFDGLTIKEKIKDRLNQTGIFTDQNYEGSNLAGFNDAIAMSFSLLLYYLNQSSVNGQFSETKIYENINRIVKELNYNPIGHQTANVGFTMSCDKLNAGVYTIPRYSSIGVGGLPYSLAKDLAFTKINNLIKEEISGIDSSTILYQGTYAEFPRFNPAGNANEIIYITVDDNTLVDNFLIDVYVKTDGVWEQWAKTQSLYIHSSEDKVFELRFGENKRYQLKFGDGINGKKLDSSNEVSIYYLISQGSKGEIGVGALNNKKIVPFTSANLSAILTESYMSASQMLNLSFTNKFPSTYYAEPESIESIRKNAPGVFRSQFNITTTKSYETFVRSNFSNIIQDVVVKNNREYLDAYIKYFYNLGLTKPQNESRALFNQVNFSDSCNFNNVYIFTVPKTIKNTLSYLTPSQKQLIIDTIKEEQILTSETVLADPVYIAFDLCVQTGNSITKDDIKNSSLYVIKTPNSRRNESSIKNDIQNVILSFFNVQNNKLGQAVNLQQLNTNLLNIDGISQVYTINTSTSSLLEGIKLAYYNPIYFDITATDSPSIVNLEDFQFPFLENPNFVDRIITK
jgi:hypothetical protein